MDRRSIAGKIEQVCEVMRSDGLTILEYIEQLSWMLFLKYLEHMEDEERIKAELEGRSYKPLIDDAYRWSNWAKKDLRADELKRFIEGELFPYLRSVRDGEEKQIISTIFSGVQQRMRDPHNLKKVIAMLDEIDFSNPEDTHTLSIVYEELLMMMGREGGAAGEYYTPRPIVKFMVRIIEPKVGEKVFDPFAGSAGFLVESYKFMKEKGLSVNEYEIVQNSFYGHELKAIPYLIGIMNCLLHGIKRPHIKRVDTFEENVRSPKERFEVIFTNPPFGGKVPEHYRDNLPYPTSYTELAALQYCMRKLAPNGRCGIVLPDGVLFKTQKTYVRVRKELVENYNVFAIVSLPQGTFAYISPKGGTGPKASLLFFDKTKSTDEIWYYELIPPYKYTKANPIKFEHLEDALKKFEKKEESEVSWIVPIEDIRKDNYDLSPRNPNRMKVKEFVEPSKLIEEIYEKEREALKLVEEIKELVDRGCS